MTTKSLNPIPIDRQDLDRKVELHASLIASSARTIARLTESLAVVAETLPADGDPEHLMRAAAQFRSLAVTIAVGCCEISSHSGHIERIGALVTESEVSR